MNVIRRSPAFAPNQSKVNLDLSDNWRQVALLVAANMFVGWMIGMERTILFGQNRIRRHFQKQRLSPSSLRLIWQSLAHGGGLGWGLYAVESPTLKELVCALQLAPAPTSTTRWTAQL